VQGEKKLIWLMETKQTASVKSGLINSR
jgi:hypothetical protein